MFLKSNRLVEQFQTFIGGLRVQFQAECHHEETYELSSKRNVIINKRIKVEFQVECHYEETYELSSNRNAIMKKRTL